MAWALAAISVITLAAPSEARADDDDGGGGGDPRSYARTELGARSFFAFGRGAYLFTGVNGHYHLHRYVAIGGYFDGSVLSDSMSGDCAYTEYGCERRAFRTGATARVDTLPTSVVDPWVGAALGGWLIHGKTDYMYSTVKGGAELEGSVGIDVRVPHVSFGPYGFAALALGNADPQLGYGIRAAARF